VVHQAHDSRPGPACRRWESLVRSWDRSVPLLILAVALLLAAILRLDALTGRYGLVTHPTWVRALQGGSHSLAGLVSPFGNWRLEAEFPHQDDRPSHYRSDPYTYLKRARAMGSFYGAHYREPVFPFAVKTFLKLLGDQDVAVSFASASFSMLCVLATYLLGSVAFSRWVGCLAALAIAIEWEVIVWGVSGWRDDAYACAVAFAACSMLLYRRTPSTARAVILGLSAAFACLTRIFSVSFLVPGVALLAWSPGSWRRSLRGVGIAAVTATVLVAPYLVNCWREFGDPLYTLNYQPLAYLGAEGVSPSTPPGAVGYIAGKLRDRSFETIDTAALGMTSYPFLNKWGGFEPWRPGLGRWLAGAALVGLILFTASATGRLLLVVLLSAQAPFAFTWRLSWDWRYTEFAYPFFLVAAGLVITRVALFARPGWWKELVVRRRSWGTVCAWALSTLGGVALIAWLILRALPVLVVREALVANRAAVIEAGPRDGLFFREGWSHWVKTYNVTARAAQGERSIVDVLLPRPADYAITVRLDPYPPPGDGAVDLPTVRIFCNNVFLGKAALTWNPERVGSYDLSVKQAVARRGLNHFTFVTERNESVPTRSFRLWYLLIRPAN
jgi:hypothetical protein